MPRGGRTSRNRSEQLAILTRAFNALFIAGRCSGLSTADVEHALAALTLSDGLSTADVELALAALTFSDGLSTVDFDEHALAGQTLSDGSSSSFFSPAAEELLEQVERDDGADCSAMTRVFNTVYECDFTVEQVREAVGSAFVYWGM